MKIALAILALIAAFIVVSAEARETDRVCLGDGIGLCLNPPANTKPGDEVGSVDGETCIHRPSIAKLPLGSGFECSVQSLEACRHVTGMAGIGIGTDGVCYDIQGE